jgi:hypothetical protein
MAHPDHPDLPPALVAQVLALVEHGPHQCLLCGELTPSIFVFERDATGRYLVASLCRDCTARSGVHEEVRKALAVAHAAQVN